MTTKQRKEAREPLWAFTDAAGSFASTAAHGVRSLYFPLANESLMSTVTPDLHGDAKTGQDTFLFEPVSRIDLSGSRSSRNFWVRTSSGTVWSCTGVSKDRAQVARDRCTVRAGLLWHRVERANPGAGLAADILTFIPAGTDAVEIMSVTITNISRRALTCTPVAALPVYARSAENIRDHRHVTSLLNRIETDAHGIFVKPTLLFSEAGHLVNEHVYFVSGFGEGGAGPRKIYATQEQFCGEGGDLEAPDAVYGHAAPRRSGIQGREAMGGLAFDPVRLAPGAARTYIIVSGVASGRAEADAAIGRYATAGKVEAAFAAMQAFWDGKAACYAVRSGDTDGDNWFRWVSIQPTLRRIFGCSFLPDFDYGKGGRGWRDLWQDLLGLILSEPSGVRDLIINNFAGVRIDGSNATIIGKRHGEFISDRNNVSRVWMDHGVWPLLTLELYMGETGDAGIIFQKAPYFLNHERARSRVIDRDWKPSDGQQLRTSSGDVYSGTIFEHLLLQNLVQFFNVGSHNHVRLEGADWNDGLDMARQHGESVAFSAMYARNLRALADILERSGADTVELAKEIAILLVKCDYASVGAKHEILNTYFHATNHALSGECTRISARRLIEDLTGKAEWMMEHIRSREWLAEGFFNGYYDNRAERVEGRRGSSVRMSLTSQVFPIMSGAALDAQVRRVCASVRRHLRDPRLGGVRLNTDFGGEQHDLGRAFSFAYGDKENGAFFNHMVVMFAFALYRRGFVAEGWQALDSIRRMALATGTSRIYPCLPEYFDGDGRGMYAYLTGSASWFVLTMMTEVFGLKGKNGDLAIEPKLCLEQFVKGAPITVHRVFAGVRLAVTFARAGKRPKGVAKVVAASLDGKPVALPGASGIVLSRSAIAALDPSLPHEVTVTLT